MTAWFLTISENYPQHWAYALEHGLWEMITPRAIKAGDLVYFWQSKGSLLGKVRATEDAYPIDVATAEPGPWDDWPGSADKTYRSRFGLEPVSTAPLEAPKWHTVAEATGLSKNPTFVRTVSPAQQEVLDSYLDGAGDPGRSLDDARREEIMASFDQDLRVQRLQLVALRRGQPQFRGQLMAAYGRRCAVTGTEVEAVLEAAHISPHMGEHTNVTWNGLLLRADIHTLFDLNLITVEADSLTVRVSPSLADSPYFDLDGSEIFLPGRLDEQPERDALRAHNALCAWLA